MKNTIKLDNPLKVNEKRFTELSYDTNEITAQMFAEADANKMRASGSKGGNLSGAVELDYGLHLFLGFAAIVAVNPEISISDLERIHGFDVMKIMRLGRSFITGKSGETSSPSNSGEPSETIPGPSAHQPGSSELEG